MGTFNYELDYSRIKDLRINNNISQKEISEYLHINQSTYSKFELNKAVIPIELLNKLANYYNVSLDYLLGLSNDKNVQTSDESSDLNIAMSIAKLYSLDSNSHLSKTQIELIKKLLLANKDFILSA